jgi:hypothetical protein
MEFLHGTSAEHQTNNNSNEDVYIIDNEIIDKKKCYWYAIPNFQRLLC